MVNKETYFEIRNQLDAAGVTLVAVSKMKTVAAIKQLYELGQRDFGENYVQELLEKQKDLPGDIRWHFIGHLQSNKAKYIVPFAHLIHGIDSFKLLVEINKQAKKVNRIANVLLQVHIASESTKFGLDEKELNEIFQNDSTRLEQLQHINIRGFMGMASFSDNMELVQSEFDALKSLYDQYAANSLPNVNMEILSMGMSDDYKIAIKSGSNMVRIGSLIFGRRGVI
jgi:PLP dependent protein